jgi:hypothetical protein
MTSASAGSRPDPKQFLTAYSDNVEEAIRSLQASRVPEEGDYAMRGVERRDIKSMAEAGVIKV